MTDPNYRAWTPAHRRGRADRCAGRDAGDAGN